MTEKLFVLLFAAVLIGGFVALFGPILAAKFETVTAILGGGGSSAPTLADPVVPERSSDALKYVIFAMVAATFFILFVTPLLFPRARRARQRVLVELAERWPFLTPLIDPDALADENMEELRAIARDAKRFEQHRSQALEIAAADFGQQADPLEATIISDAPGRDRSHDPEATVDAVARPIRPVRAHADDEIPFGAVSPTHKPQMAPLTPRHAPRDALPQIPTAGDSGTTNVTSIPDDDAFVARVLRESGNFPLATDSEEATVIRDAMHEEAPTVTRDALRRPDPADTLQGSRRRATDPDATTGQGWDIPK